MTDRVRVVIYSRPGCHLCEEAKAVMRMAGCEDRYILEEVNIDDDPELKRRYGNDIPVITVAGIEVFKHRLRVEEFRARVREAAADSLGRAE